MSENPRWLAYCKSQGRTSADQLEHDRSTYKGGSMTGFICWMLDKRCEFAKANGARDLTELKLRWGDSFNERFDVFLFE